MLHTGSSTTQFLASTEQPQDVSPKKQGYTVHKYLDNMHRTNSLLHHDRHVLGMVAQDCDPSPQKAQIQAFLVLDTQDPGFSISTHHTHTEYKLSGSLLEIELVLFQSLLQSRKDWNSGMLVSPYLPVWFLMKDDTPHRTL